ncbi:TPA: hypothetical protein ACGFXV_003147 [Vibrio cholerae]
MKQEKVVITINDKGNGKIEFACQCENGSSNTINGLANHIAEDLPVHVHKAAIEFYNKKGNKNAIH